MRPTFPLAAICLLAAMAWFTADWTRWADGTLFKGQKRDYYNLLVDGFQGGHLYMKAEMHPGRLSPDAQVRLNSPYLMDASEYNGRYYLYFGVVPAVLVFWPYAALTGHDLHENAAVFLAVALGFLVTLRLYAAARMRYFPAQSAWGDVLASLLLGFATCTPSLLVAGGMYEVAIAYSYLSVSSLLACLYGALHAAKPGRWLAAASLCFGLSVGCRPTFILLGPLVAACGAWLWWRDRHNIAIRRVLQLAAATLAPAGLVGLALMAYNYGRFGNPLEFGLTYQLNSLQGTNKPLASAAFIPFNLDWYYFTRPVLSPYFPYVFPLDTGNAPASYFGWEPIHGQWLVTALTAALSVIVLLRRHAAHRILPGPLLVFWLLTAVGFVIIAVVTSSFGIRSNRYMVDFQGMLILLIVLGAGWTLSGETRPRTDAWLRSGFALLAFLTVLHNTALALQLLDLFKNKRPDTFRHLAFRGNKPAAWLARTGRHSYGPLRFKVKFTQPTAPVLQSVLATGTPGYKDVLQVGLYPNGYMDFIVFHENYGGARSILLPVEWGREYVVELDMGSLYPPAPEIFPAFWDTTRPSMLKTIGRLSLDGVEIIRTRQAFHDSPPYAVQPSEGPPGNQADVSALVRLPPRDIASLDVLREPGVWRMELEVPAKLSDTNLPLLSSGISGAGNLLYLQAVSPAEFRFVIDFWSIGTAASPPLPRLPGTRRHIEVFVGAQVLKRFAPQFADLDPSRRNKIQQAMCVWLDGVLVWTTVLQAHHETYDFVGIGINTQGFSTAQAAFDGQFRLLPMSEADRQSLVESGLRAVTSTP